MSRVTIVKRLHHKRLLNERKQREIEWLTTQAPATALSRPKEKPMPKTATRRPSATEINRAHLADVLARLKAKADIPPPPPPTDLEIRQELDGRQAKDAAKAAIWRDDTAPRLQAGLKACT